MSSLTTSRLLSETDSSSRNWFDTCSRLSRIKHVVDRAKAPVKTHSLVKADGEFMTAWVTTKTHRFKAAQTDRMISNWFSWYGTSEAQGLTEFEFYGKPWDNPDLYWELSPIKYVGNVRTPTLLVQSEEDHRTPMTDAEQWFMALRKQGVPAEFVRYPRSNHNLSRSGEPWLLVDRLGRLRQWFTHWLADGVTTDRPQ